MTKTRFSVNEHGELVSRDGEVLGRITSLTLEAPSRTSATSGEPVGAMGGGVGVEVQTTLEDHPRTPIDDVWDHYVSLFGSAYKLTPQCKRIIRNAIDVRSVEAAKKAISGLRFSPHHNGENEQKLKYLHIRYALKGNQRTGESSEERIDRMGVIADQHAEIASSSPIPVGFSPVVTGTLRTALNEHREAMRRGDEAWAARIRDGLPRAFTFDQAADGSWRIIQTESA